MVEVRGLGRVGPGVAAAGLARVAALEENKLARAVAALSASGVGPAGEVKHSEAREAALQAAEAARAKAAKLATAAAEVENEAVHIVHCAVPDLRYAHSRDQAGRFLTAAYARVLREFLQSGCGVLRMAPLGANADRVCCFW